MKKGTIVRVGNRAAVPVRYRKRIGVVVGIKKVGSGFNYLVDFGSLRVNPLPVPKNVLTRLF